MLSSSQYTLGMRQKYTKLNQACSDQGIRMFQLSFVFASKDSPTSSQDRSQIFSPLQPPLVLFPSPSTPAIKVSNFTAEVFTMSPIVAARSWTTVCWWSGMVLWVVKTTGWWRTVGDHRGVCRGTLWCRGTRTTSVVLLRRQVIPWYEDNGCYISDIFSLCFFTCNS